MTLGGATTCPCKGKRGYGWHYSNSVPLCDHGRAQRQTYRRTRKEKVESGVVTWVPGTDIYVPEFEAL